MRNNIKCGCVAALLTLFFGAATAQMTKPEQWQGYEEVFGVKVGLRHYDYDVLPVSSSAPANVFWKGDEIRFDFQLTNLTARPIETTAQVHVIQYGTTGIPNNIWLPKVEKRAFEKVIDVPVSIQPNGYVRVPVTIEGITEFGGYAVVFDLGKNGRRLATSFVYSIQPDPVRMQYPKQALDDIGAKFLSRIGVQAIRTGVPYVATTRSNYRSWMQSFGESMKNYRDHNITVLAMFGEGGADMPLGTPRSHLDESGKFLRTKQDYVWLPSQDEDFKIFVKNMLREYGWPKGPITAVSLWNEPWEGISISGWQADMIRYREIYTKMAEAVIELRSEGIDVLVGGGDSNSNALDKFFADGTNDIFPIFDFLSIHYQGMESPVLYPDWISRKDHKGRVLIWDTESWVGNTDDRIGLVVAANRSAGYDRSMGIYGGYMYTGKESDVIRVQTPGGEQQMSAVNSAWSAAAAMGAVQYLIGEREFRELLFKNGLPWVMLFDGYKGNREDGTVVIAGDLGEAFGAENILFRQVRSLTEVKRRMALHDELKSLPAGSGEAAAIERQLAEYRPITDGRMVVKAHRSFRLYDFYGNTIAPKNGVYEIPLNYQGYYLRTDGSKGSFNRLVKAVSVARIEGYAPVEIVAKDLKARIGNAPEVELVLTNVLNRPVKGRLQVGMEGLKLDYPETLALKANETKSVRVRVVSGKENGENAYPMEVLFDAGADGLAVHWETMHVNLISRRTVRIDGYLDDWDGAVPQVVKGSSQASVTLTEAAWYPFENFDKNAEGMAQAYLAYDDEYFYFAAKVADKTPNAGTFRFETRDDDQFFYPDTAYMQTIGAMHSTEVCRRADERETGALLLPDGNGRVMNYMENVRTTQSIGIDLDLPSDRFTRTSFYFPNVAQHGVAVTVFDRESGKELYATRIDKLWNGAYLTLDLSGEVRVRCSAYGWWYTAKLAGVFFDESDDVTPGVPTARPVALDFDTEGNWNGKYGALGYYMVGEMPSLPAGVVCRPVEYDELVALPWPAGVRRYTYRKRPVLPDGNSGENFDNILIAFNVLPIGEDGMEAAAPGTMPRYVGYKCTDYEYALNTVAPCYGGGTEIWRMLVPGMPRKHFYPRQPKSPYDGAVKEGRLVTRRDGNTLYTECAIPWSEIPDVKAAIDRDGVIKFSFRVNDDGAPAACMELAKGRSVSKRNSRAFHPDWKEHWANELEFAVEK